MSDRMASDEPEKSREPDIVIPESIIVTGIPDTAGDTSTPELYEDKILEIDEDIRYLYGTRYLNRTGHFSLRIPFRAEELKYSDLINYAEDRLHLVFGDDIDNLSFSVICSYLKIEFDDKSFMNRNDDLLKSEIHNFIARIEAVYGEEFTEARKKELFGSIAICIKEGKRAERPELALPTRETLESEGRLFKDRCIDEVTGRQIDIIKFLETGWPAPFIASGVLTRPDFRRIDKEGETALRGWLHFTQNPLPDNLKIPTKREALEEELGHLDRERLREARRLVRAHDRRQGSGR